MNFIDFEWLFSLFWLYKIKNLFEKKAKETFLFDIINQSLIILMQYKM